MYSTKLTVSHAICSELTPRKTNMLQILFFLSFLLHSKSFTSDKVVKKGTQCESPVPTMYKPNVFKLFPVQQVWKIQTITISQESKRTNKKAKQCKEQGVIEKNTTQMVALSLYFSPLISGNNLPRSLNYKLHSFPLVVK